MTGIEEDDAILVRLVVFLIASEEHIGSHIWEHLTNTVNEDIRFV